MGGHISNVSEFMEGLTHGDVVNGLEWSVLGRLNGFPVQIIQRIDSESLLGLLFSPLRA